MPIAHELNTEINAIQEAIRGCKRKIKTCQQFILYLILLKDVIAPTHPDLDFKDLIPNYHYSVLDCLELLFIERPKLTALEEQAEQLEHHLARLEHNLCTQTAEAEDKAWQSYLHSM